MKGEVIMACQYRGNREKNMQVDEGEEVQVDLNSSLGRQSMRGWRREREGGWRLVKVKRDFVRYFFPLFSCIPS